jgi:hypothetical protein
MQNEQATFQLEIEKSGAGSIQPPILPKRAWEVALISFLASLFAGSGFFLSSYETLFQ